MATQLYVVVEVKAGLIPTTVEVLPESKKVPETKWPFPPSAVLAQVPPAARLAPQVVAVGIDPVFVGNVVVIFPA